MDWIKNFFTPLFQVMFLMGLTLGLIFILIRAILKTWKKKWRFDIKYKLKRQDYNMEDIGWILNKMETLTKPQIHRRLLLESQKEERIYELLYLYDKIKKKEDNENVRQTKRSSREAKKERRNKGKAKS